MLNIRRYLLAAALCGCCGLNTYAKEITNADAEVTPRDPSDTGHDTSVAETAAPHETLAGFFHIVSITFENPDQYFFVASSTRATIPNVANIATPGNGITATRTRITFDAVFPDRPDGGNADYFPVFIDGDLTPKGGGGGGPAQPNPKVWASTIRMNNDTRGMLYINQNGDEEDDLVLVADEDEPRPFAEVTVVLDGTANETKTVKLEIESSHEGITLEDDEFEVTVGDRHTVKLFSTVHSADWNSDKINLRFIEDGEQTEVIDTQDLTAVQLDSVVLSGRDDDLDVDEGSEKFVYVEVGGDEVEKVRVAPGLLPEPTEEELGYVDEMFAAQFLWSLDAIAGLGADDIDPVNDNGDERAYGVTDDPHIGFRLNELPAANDGFGQLGVTVRVYATASNSNEIGSATPDPAAELFFQKTLTGNPGGATANWHYYWSKEGKGAGQAVCQFSRDPNDAAYAKWVESVDENGSFGAYDEANDEILISDDAAERATAANPWSTDFPLNQNAGNQDWVHYTVSIGNAPDFVNAVYAHEKTHRICSTHGLQDSDTDGVPDAWEGTAAVPVIPGMDLNSDDSFGNQFRISLRSGASRDEEFYCVLGTAFGFGSVTNGRNGAALNANVYNGEVPVDADESLDWSFEGHNW